MIHWETCKKFKFYHKNKWYIHNPASVLENNTQTPTRLWHTNGSRNLDQKTRPNNKQKSAIAADHRIKLKECEKKDKYLDLARELKKLWNMQVTIIQIVIGAFGTVTKGLTKGLEDLEIKGQVETIQTTTLLRTARVLRKPCRLKETCCHSNSYERPLSNVDVKNCNKQINKWCLQ